MSPTLAEIVAAGTRKSQAAGEVAAARRSARRASPPGPDEREAPVTVRTPTRPFAVLRWRHRSFVEVHSEHDSYTEAEAAGARAFAEARPEHGGSPGDLFVPVEVEAYVERVGSLPGD